MPKTTIPTDVAKPAAEEVEAQPVVLNVEGEETGTPEGEEAEGAEPVLSDREQIMADMARRQREKRGTPPIEEDELDDDHADDLPPDQTMVTLKVNGKEVQKTQAEVDAAGGIAAIQKSLSGDEKLALAAQQQKELDQEKQRIKQIEADNAQLRTEFTQLRSLVAAQTSKGTVQTPEAIAARREKAKKIAQKIFNGDAAELEEAVDNLLDSASQPASVNTPMPQINEDSIAKKVERQIEFNADRKTALQMFEKDHADLNSIPGRKNYVDKLTLVVMKEHPDWMPSQIIEEAVNRTREDLSIPKPAAADPPPPVLTTLEQRRERKRASTDVIPQASQRGSVPKTDNKPKTAEQIFAEMNASRSHSA